MRTDELMQDLLREYPNGVSFTPTALRLLRLKFSLEDSQIESLKAKMIQLGEGLWFFGDMIADEKAQLALRRQAMTWLNEQGCFSVERLFECFCGDLRHIESPENLAAFLKYLDFTVRAWSTWGFFCLQPPLSLFERLAEESRTIVALIEEAGGTLALSEIQEAMPHLAIEALEGIRRQFLPEIYRTEVGEHPFWRSVGAIHLPEDFAEIVTAVVDNLVALGEKVTAANVEFALNLSYSIRFREVYGLPDKGELLRVCSKHYLGGNEVFSSTSSGKRVRSPNTRFRNLGVPIGAELVFTRDSHVTCTVLDGGKQVEYQGKPFAISALATRLLNMSVANGYSYFSYEGETLLERRLRLHREAEPDVQQTKAMPPSMADKQAESDIIGLSGQPLLPATWDSYKSSGTSLLVAEWARRVENGETVKAIARESGFKASTIQVQIGDRRRYFKVCEINQIVPEGEADV